MIEEVNCISTPLSKHSQQTSHGSTGLIPRVITVLAVEIARIGSSYPCNELVRKVINTPHRWKGDMDLSTSIPFSRSPKPRAINGLSKIVLSILG